MNKQELISQALMVSDNFALFKKSGTAGDIQIVAINLAKTSSKLTIRLYDMSVLSTNMSNSMLIRALDAIKRNKQLIEEML